MWTMAPMMFGGGAVGPDEVAIWESRINALGGTILSGERTIAEDVIAQIQAASFNTKIVYLLPFIGAGVACARVPLRDALNVGAATSTGFVDADCTTAGGLDNSAEGTKYLNTNIKPSELGASNNGALGWWELNWGNGSNVSPMGCYSLTNSPDERFVLDLRSSFQRFRWGGVTNSQAGPATTTSNGHYYGQRSSSTLRRIYKDGVSLGSDGTNLDAASAANEQNIIVMGAMVNGGVVEPWKGVSGVAYLTDGTMSDMQVSDFHTLLDTYLITPTGR